MEYSFFKLNLNGVLSDCYRLPYANQVIRMKDLKKITKSRFVLFPSSISRFFERKRRAKNSYRIKPESKKQKRILRYVLTVICLILAVYPISSLLKSGISGLISLKGEESGRANAASRDQVAYKSFSEAADALRNAHLEGEKLVARLSDGGFLTYTISTSLQRRVEAVMAENSVPYGVFVAIEPKTGKVLALTGYSFSSPGWEGEAYKNIYPMASLFKMITACAALEEDKIEPETLFAFRGSSYSENPKYWSVNPKKVGQQMPLSIAMGKSINPVFGRLASDVVGRDSIMQFVNRFGFNQNLFPGASILPSTAPVPKDDSELKLMGCGLGREVKISPLHAAVMMAALANKGTMMSPVLVEERRDTQNSILPVEKARVIGQLVTSKTTEKLSRMLMTTVTDGTSRRAFHDRSGRPILRDINICAKTGSINGTDPEGKYTWFAAYAPAEDPKIALVALIINQGKWKIKASRLGAEALEEFFRDDVIGNTNEDRDNI